MILFLDTETTGINKAIDRIVQVAWVIADYDGLVSAKKSFIIRPDGFYIPRSSTAIHGITNDIAEKNGSSLVDVLNELARDAEDAEMLVAHNASFDTGFLKGEFANLDLEYPFDALKTICTMMVSTNYCRLEKTNGMSGYKRPKLEELHFFLFKEYFDNAHDALADTEACMRCFYELVERGVVGLNIENNYQQHPIQDKENNSENRYLKSEVDKLKKELQTYKEDIKRRAFLESPEGIFQLASTSRDAYWNLAAINHPLCPENLILDIAQQTIEYKRKHPQYKPDSKLLKDILKNTALSSDIIMLLLAEVAEYDLECLQAALSNPNCDEDLVAEICWYTDFDCIEDAQKHPSYSLEAIHKKFFQILQDEESCEEARSWVAENQLAPKDILEVLSKDNHSLVRAAVAKNINCPSNVLLLLGKDNKTEVRDNAYSNPNYPGY